MRMGEQQSSDTTYTKVFVGGLAWETHRDTMKRHFQQFGEILEAVIITDKTTGRSKGYGFVTFRDPEAARRACEDATPIIDGRRANCNLASLGAQNRSRPMFPFGQGNKHYRSMAPIPHQGGAMYMGAPVYFQQGNYALQYGFPYQSYGYPYSPEIVYQPGMYNPYGGLQYSQVYSGPTAATGVGNSPVYTYMQVSQPSSPGFSLQIPQVMQYGAPATTTLSQQPYGFVPVSPSIASTDKECVVALCWSSPLSEVYSCSNDHSIWKWSRTGQPLSKVYTYQENFTDIHWQPHTAQGQSKAIGSDTFAVSCTNGAFCIISKGGQDEHHIDAHKGAILCLRWNIEGSALATGGQDGFVKVWSRNGMLRSNVFEGENSVFALAWAPESNQLIFSSANNLVIKYVQSSSKHVQWKAHEGLVVKIDWNRTNNLIISVGEEGCYKVWDCFGRLSYISHPYETCPTSIAWCPSGEVFVVGFHNSIILCHKRGWILSKENFEVAIVKTIAWSIDGSQLAVGCTNGTVVFSHVVGRSVEWLHIKALVEDLDHIQIEDFLAGKAKKLEFRDIIISMSLGFGHLIVTTMWQCIIYNVHEWESPHLINIKNISTIMKQCDHCFLIAAFPNEVQIITYDGRKLSDPYFPGLRVDLLNNQNISLSKDMLAVVDSTDNKRLKVLDFITRKEFKDVLHHTEPIIEVGLNQQGTTSDRMIIFLDSNNDLFISPVLKPCITKLAWMTTKAIWNDHADIVVAIVDENLVIWYYPQAIFIDTELLKLLHLKKESFQGKSPDICSSLGRHCTVQYGSGGNVTISLSPIAYLLFDYILQNLWDEAKKLCWRFKEMPLWAILAAAAMHRKMFCVAVEAYAVLGEVDKVNFINHLKAQTSKVVCEAEYALFTRQAKEAELILLNSGLIYRAIKLNIRLFNWDRALELAVTHKKHVDTVLWKRCKYLLSTNQKETKETFQNLLSEVHINVDKIKQMISEEKSAEKNLKEIIV